MDQSIQQSDLEAYLDEALPPEEMAAIEEVIRQDENVRQRLSMINGRRDAGIHTLGEIWRRHRLTCPSREKLILYLDQKLPEDELQYIQFHLESIQCRLCVASAEDIEISRQNRDQDVESRHQRFVSKSSNYLRKRE